jgi:hypothetical protein
MPDFSLSPEQREFQKAARDFAMKEILPVAWHYDDIDENLLYLVRMVFEASGQGWTARRGMRGVKALRCPMRGYVHYGDDPPGECPCCPVRGTGFKQVRAGA